MKKLFIIVLMSGLMSGLVLTGGIGLFASAAAEQSGEGSAGPVLKDQDPKKQHPQTQQWIAKLGRLAALERLALAQYTADSERLNLSMPYRSILPQKEGHIQTLTELLSTVGSSAEAAPQKAVQTRTIPQAYRVGIKMEQDLATLCEWLLRNTRDRNTADTLNQILIETRKHLGLFEYGLKARSGPWNEIGPGGIMRR